MRGHLAQNGMRPVMAQHGPVFRPFHDAARREHMGDVGGGHKAGHVIVDGRLQYLLRRAGLHHRAVLQQHNAVAKPEGLVQIVGNKDDGFVDILLERQEFLLHFLPDKRIKRAEGLVHEQHFRLHCQGAGKAHTLLHAAGKLPGIGIGPLGKAHALEHFAAFFQAQGLAHPHGLKAEGRVLQHSAVWKKGKILKNHAKAALPHAAQLARLHLHDVLIIHQHGTSRGHDEPVEAAQQCGLAAAGKPHDHEQLTLCYIEGNITQRHGGAGLPQNIFAGTPLGCQLKGMLRIWPKDLEQILDGNLRHILSFCRSRKPLRV